MSTATLCVSSLSLLHFLLGVRVSRERIRAQQAFGCPEDAKHPLAIAIRAHSNSGDWVPLFVALVGFSMAKAGGGERLPRSINRLFLLFTLSRFLHAAGIFRTANMRRVDVLRKIAAAMTYLTGVGISIGVAFC